MTQHIQPSSEFIIFVTHIEADGIYLKIWGQLDKQAATCVERFIHPLAEKFSQGYGCPSKSNRLDVGALCCAKFQTDGYYRAKVLDIRPDGMIVVQFIDYGNIEVLQPNEIHLLESIPGSELLRSYPAMAIEFTLVNVLPVNGIWENRTIETIKKSLCYNEYRALIHPMINNHCLIKLWYDNEDFSKILVKEQMALPATLHDMFRLKPSQPQMLVYQQQIKNSGNNFTTKSVMQNTNINQDINMQGQFHKNYSPGISQQEHNMQSSSAQEALVFKSRVLDVDSRHKVLVSFVEDGPQKFSVQIQDTTEILTHLMNEINNHPKQPLQEPPLPGAVCLGRYTVDKVLCRAVVMSVMEHKCKLYYVDFGHTEVLPYTDIFQLPPEYISPKVLSIRFTLSGLRELNITPEMKEYFKELVSRKLLVLHVRPPEGPPLIQYGDLYDNGINIKNILKKTFPAPVALAVQGTCLYTQLRLSKGAEETVHVSFVESYKKFFIQRESGIKSLQSIMVGLAQYAKTASTLNVTQLHVGLPCAALYGSQWYRAQILDIIRDKVKVAYIDYGNEEILPVMSLRTIHEDLMTKLPAQAIKCTLSGFEVFPSEREVSAHFIKLTFEKRLYMKVIATQSSGLLVQLFDLEGMKDIHSLLLNNIFSSKTRNTTSSSQNGQTPYSTKTTDLNNLKSEDIDKSNKKSNIQEKQYDNSRRERISASSHRDSLQTDRFNKDEFPNNRPGKDRLYNRHKSEIDTFNRGGRTFRGDRNKFSGSESRYNRNNSIDKVWNDKDSDTSSKGSTKHGKGGFNRIVRGAKRDGGVSTRLQLTKWNDRDNDRSNYKNGKFNGNYNMGNYNSKFRNKEINVYEKREIGNVNKEVHNRAVINRGSQPLLINITLGTVKTCEVIFTNSPSDFFIQLSPDYLALEIIMKKIAIIYENGGEIMKLSEIQCGTYCIAQYVEDLKWYRAVIRSVENNNANVQFIDYGNTESIDFTKIKIIQQEFLKLPIQAIHCKLLGFTNMDNKESTNTIFMEKVEGKSLTVEFIVEENGIYEVLLREVIDGVSKTNYINEEFCTSADLSKAKEMATSKKLTKIMIKEKRATSDYASFDSKWQTILYESESDHDVIITWFINPNKFYCQILAKEAEFKTMMNEIQSTYADREPVTHKLEVGTAVIAVFSEDDALYRAEILGNNGEKEYTVQYIDFGNCTIVNQCNIYLVEKKFMHLPRLAVECSLKDIIPVNNSSWSKLDSNALDNCFNADRYKCTFHHFNESRCTISLSHDGQDVSSTLVERNLAALIPRDDVVDSKLDDAVEVSNEKTRILNDIERVDISLLSGQTIRMRVSSVENTTKFHVQLPTASRCQDTIDKYMIDKNTEVMPRLSSREICLGAGCLVNANGTWRRAVVINCSESIRFNVKFIDTGAYDEILDGPLSLPGELSVMQNQALECCLQNVSASSDANEHLKELIEGKEVLIYVEEVNNSRLFVKLYDLFGNGIMNTEEKDEKISPLCPMPILSSTHKVYVSYADHFANIWLQRCSEHETDIKLLEDLAKYYSDPRQKLKPELHALCAAKSADGRWYRGMIIKYTETVAYVNFVDYGNTEEIQLESLMVLEPQFYELYQLAVNVSLSVALTGTEPEQVNILQTHLLNKELTAVFYNVHKKWIVDLIENGQKLSDKLHSLNLVEQEQVSSDMPLQIHEASINCKYDVCVSHVDSPSQFWLQYMDEFMSLTKKQEELQLEAPGFSIMDGIPEEGTLCVAIYSINNCWYRAEVLDADEDIATVRFIDYGNTDVIDNTAENIRRLPDAWKNIEKFAFKCRLDVIPVNSEDWNEATCKKFESLVSSVDTLQALIIANTMPKRVELFIDNKSVSEILVEENHAIIINTEQEFIDEIVDLELDPHSAFVSHVNSLNEFWIQEEKSVADLEVMTDRFMVADMFPKIDDIKEDLLCVAKYPEDERWYRARVVSHNDYGTRVRYIDYGNSAISTEIRAIPEDLAHIPPLSRKCCLELPPHVKEWSEQACKEFVKLVADGATILLLDILKEQETSLVRLTLDSKNVADILASMCDQHLPVIEERLPPLGEENSPNVVVSHINSPDEFWIQVESSITELETMSDRLRAASSFLTLNIFDIGTICAAQYSEDGFWCRAKILAHHEEGIKVLYIDYGNSAVTKELRILPEDIVNIPTLSKRCTLKKPSYITSWTEEACEKFKELAAKGATMFQFEILDENDPMHVRLNLNGTDIVTLLSTECENIPKIRETEIKDTTSKIDEQSRNVISETVFHNDNPTINDIHEEILDFNKTSTTIPTTICLDESVSTVTELSVDEIVENMIRDVTDDLELQETSSDNSRNEDNICLSGTIQSETQSVIQDNIDEEKKLCSININESLNPRTLEKTSLKEEILNSMVKDVHEDLNPQKILLDNSNPETSENLLIASDIRPYGVQLGASDEQKLSSSERQSISINEPSDAQILGTTNLHEIIFDDVSCSSEKQIILEQTQKQVPILSKDDIIIRNVEKNNDLESTTNDDLNISSESAHTLKTERIAIPN